MNNNNKNHQTPLGLSLSQHVAMAQQLGYSPAVQNILDAVQSECQKLTDSIGYEGVLAGHCVAIKHESPTLVVLDAKMFFVDTSEVGRFVENGFIWDAVNGFILQGYSVDSVVYSSAQRNEPNPDEFTVVMSKP